MRAALLLDFPPEICHYCCISHLHWRRYHRLLLLLLVARYVLLDLVPIPCGVKERRSVSPLLLFIIHWTHVVGPGVDEREGEIAHAWPW